MTNVEILKHLQNNNIDTSSALERFLDNQEMYIMYIKKFAQDPSFYQIEKYLTDKKWEQAFELTHALKGITGNLGITELFTAFSQIAVAYRKQDFTEMKDLYFKTKKKYIQTCDLFSQL